MAFARARRTPHAFTAAALASVVLPFSLTACSQPEALGSARAAELQAANESDLLSVPVERVYEVSEFEITAPQLLASLSAASRAQTVYSGYVVLSDDVITASQISFELTGVQSASFTLTEPTVVRRAEGETDPVYATGQITIGDYEPQISTVKLTPVVIDDETLEFTIDLGLETQAGAAFEENGFAPTETSARVELSAVPSSE